MLWIWYSGALLFHYLDQSMVFKPKLRNSRYGHSFGAPLARSLGVGYIQELVSRLTHTPIAVHKTSTNATLDNNPTTFPLNQALYVDATHEVVVLNIITALNLTSFAAGGPLPSDHIPKDRTFYSSKLAPFGTNMQFQRPLSRFFVIDRC